METPQTLPPLSELIPIASQCKVVITTHHKPDADALGSSLGLYHYLHIRGVEHVSVVTPTDYGSFLTWMPGEKDVVNFEENQGLAIQLVNEADLIFCLDFNTLTRINHLGTIVRNAKGIKILMDHHLQPEGFEKFRLWDTTACSTAEIVYRYIVQNNDLGLLNKPMAECLYAGVLTDTGNFRHDTTTAQTHRMVADLLDAGVVSHQIHHWLYDQFTLNRTRFVGYVLAHKLEILPDLPVAIMSVTKDEIAQYQITTGDTEGLVNAGLSIQGIRLAILVIDRTIKIKMSFRGTGEFPCNEFARKHFQGGGHFSAAGGESTRSLSETLSDIKTHLQSYKEILCN